MTKGILGRKIGMTQVFAENGELIPVTVIAANPNVVLQKKTTETDGYNAIQLGFEDKREKLTNKPEQGHTAKASTTPKRFIREIRDADVDGLEVGQEVKVEVFAAGEIVDVTGISKGKGFQGCVKRHGFRSRNRSNISLSHRTMGSAGMNQTPGRVFPGKKMPGHLGNVLRTVQCLTIARIDPERNLLLIRGAIPGPPGGQVIVTPSIKGGN